ncbi:MAG: 5-oxoprolinase subunit PxpB [Vicinamibacterales bacterium]
MRAAGDTLLLVELGTTVDPVINERAIQMADALRTRMLPGVRDVVPAYCSVGIHFDPLRTNLRLVEQAIGDAVRSLGEVDAVPERRVIDVEVVYGGAGGLDLSAVAEWAGLSATEVIARHADRTYRVYMLGFVPGFAYMGRVDAAIAAPRHRVPRERVPAGSVGIAGEQTGVYPTSTPGGWQIIGQTSRVLFQADRVPPSLFSPGDRVRFVPAAGVLA